MKFNFFIFSFVLLLVIINVSALSWNVCIDKQAPEAPSGVSVSGNVLLSWDEALDLPKSTSECTFGIEYYNVYLDGVLIGTSSNLSYSGEHLSDGAYILGVSAVDRAGNEGERAIKEVVFPLTSSPVTDNGGSSSGGHSSGSGDSNGGGSNKDVVVVSSTTEGDDSNSSGNKGASDLGFSELKDGGISDAEQKGGFISLLTGAVIGGGIVDWTLALIFILLVIWALFLIAKKRKDSEAVAASSAKAGSSRAKKTAKKSSVASKRTSKKK